MKCTHCEKEIRISSDDFYDIVHCPHCGRKSRELEKLVTGILTRKAWEIFAIWLVLSGIFAAVFFGIDNSITWAPATSILASIVLLDILFAYVIYYHAKCYGRNAVAWATAFVVFSPLWAGIAYLLTWPKRY